VLLGGAGLSTNPGGVLEYLGADGAVEGPGEGVVCGAFSALCSGQMGKNIFRRKYEFEISCPRKSSGIEYAKYTGAGGIAGFETHKGCSSSCIYCTEANTRVSFRKVPEIIREIGSFVGLGMRRFHLCDSEFNEDPDYAIGFLKALKDSGIAIDWALYMKPAHHNRKLFWLMKATGVSLITLSVDSWKKCPLYWDEIEKIVFSAKSNGIRIVVDFLTGFPYEDDDTVKFYLDLFRRIQPDSIGINTYIRLYKSLRITDIIARDPALKANITGCLEDESLVHPVFYNQLLVERLQEMIKDEPMFRVEGFERAVNYNRNGECS